MTVFILGRLLTYLVGMCHDLGSKGTRAPNKLDNPGSCGQWAEGSGQRLREA